MPYLGTTWGVSVAVICDRWTLQAAICNELLIADEADVGLTQQPIPFVIPRAIGSSFRGPLFSPTGAADTSFP